MVVILFVLGLFVGSFLNTVVLRIGTQEKIVNSRSCCPRCGHKLGFWDLIPVFSFLFLRGHCRYCGNKISYFYPLGEILTGLVFASLYFKFHQIPEFNLGFYFLKNGHILAPLFLISFLFYFSILIVISLFDLKNYLIPLKPLVIGAAGAVIFNLIFYFNKAFLGFNFLGGYFSSGIPGNFWLNKVWGALFAALLFFLLWFFSKGRAIGFGDWQLGAFIGFILGLPETIMAIFLSFLLGSILALILIPLKRLKFKSHIPYAPFISLGALTTILIGEKLLTFYLKLFGVI